jgi:hypothetical protein
MIMPKSRRLVTQHLEGVSWKLLKDYPHLINDMIKRRAGVYALYKNDQLYYVGLASNLMGRLKTHIRGKQGSWDRFSVYLTLRDEHIKELESLLLRIVKPEGNKQQGKFVQSQNLHPLLNKLVDEKLKDQKADLMGGRVALQHQLAKGKKAKGKGALKGLVNRRITLKAWRGGFEYTASLRKDGMIGYDGQLFDSPNAAATAALGKPAGGWGFWRFKDKSGDWVLLRILKGQ